MTLLQEISDCILFQMAKGYAYLLWPGLIMWLNMMKPALYIDDKELVDYVVEII